MDDVFELPVSGIPSQLKIKGSSQTLEFDDLSFVQLIKKNKVVPTLIADTTTREGFYNSNDCGFVFDHITSNEDSIGKFKLRSKFNDIYTDIFIIDDDNLLTFTSEVVFSGLNLPKLGIGIDPDVSGRIQFSETQMVNKLSLYNSGEDDYDQSGFGCTVLGTLYHAPLGTSHTFYLGNSSTIPFRVNSLGVYLYEGKTIDSDFRRLMLYEEFENVNQIYNIGIKDLGSSNYAIHTQISQLNGAVTWGSGLDSDSSALLMSLRGDSLAKNINFKIINPLEASIGEPSYAQLDLVNSTSGGIRFLHTSAVADTSGLGTLKIQLVNSSSSAFDAFTVSSDVFGVKTTFNGAAVFNTGITSFDNTVLLTGNSLTFNPLVITNANTSGNTFLRFNSIFKIGYDNANFLSYLDSTTVPFTITFGANTAVYIDNSTRNVGFRNSAPHADLQLDNTVSSRKFVFYEAANNDHQVKGIGHTSGVFRFQINQTSDSYVFFAGVNSSTSNEVGRITGAGDYISPGTIYGRRSSGSVGMSGNGTVTIVGGGTWTKVSGTTSLNSDSNRFSSPSSNRLRSTDSLVGAIIIASGSFSHNVAAGATTNFAIYKNGTRVGESISSVRTAQNDKGSFSSVAFLSFNVNDFVEVFCMCSAGGNVLVSDMALQAFAV